MPMSGHKKNNLHDKRVAVRDADVVTLFFMLETANLCLPSNLVKFSDVSAYHIRRRVLCHWTC